MVLKALATALTPSGDGLTTASAEDYRVEQGPEWLADLLVDAPTWLVALAVLIGIGAVFGVALLHRRDPITREEGVEMAASVSIVASCGLGAWTFKTLGAFGYLIDVFGGWAVGAILGLGIARVIRQAADDGSESEPEDAGTSTPS